MLNMDPMTAKVLVSLLETIPNKAGFRSTSSLGESDQVRGALAKLLRAGIIEDVDVIHKQCRLSAAAAQASKESLRVSARFERQWHDLIIWTVPCRNGSLNQIKIVVFEGKTRQVSDAEVLNGLFGSREVVILPELPEVPRLWVRARVL